MTYIASEKRRVSHSIKMVYGEDAGRNYATSPPSYHQKPVNAEKVLATCVSDGNRYYKIRWKDTWEREDCLVACEELVREFWDKVEEKNHNNNNSYQLNKNEIADDKFSRDALKSPSPPSTYGRRKGRPKKLANHTYPNSSLYEINHLEPNEDLRRIEQGRHSPDASILREKNPLHVEIPNANNNARVNSPGVEEYPVMIIGENGNEVVNDSSVRMQANEHEQHSPQSGNEQKVVYSHELSLEGKRCYSADIPRSVIENCPVMKHSRLSVSEDYRPATKVSPVYISSFSHSSHHPLSTSYPVIKSKDSLIAEEFPVAYKNRPPIIEKGARVHYVISDARTNDKIEKQPTTIKGDVKIEPAQLLLKVTAPGPVSSTNFVSQSSQHFPVYRTSPIVSTIKQTKDTKLKSTNILHKIVDGEQRPQCSECFQTFKKRAALERHMMIHRGIKPFQCHFCNQRFRQKHHLQGHIMLHTGERPHSCTLCNKKFRMRHHLLEHERISHKVFR